MSIINHLNAGYPIVAVTCADDGPLIRSIESADDSRELATYSASGAILDADGHVVADQQNWRQAFQWTTEAPDRVLFVHDCQHVISNAPIYRALLDAMPTLKAKGSAIVLVAPHWQLPRELQHSCPVISVALPTRDELRQPLSVVAESAAIELNGNTDLLLDAATGLTLDEAESAFALSVVESGGNVVPSIVQREKMRTIAQTGYLTVSDPVDVESIGGLGQLKGYLDSEVKPVCRDPQLAVRGVLLVGIPGTGKSLASMASASVLGWPLVRLDVAACKGGLVGQSEANIRHATELAEAISPCVLWIDELEKAVGGYRSSSSTDGGTTLGMVGHLLTWLQSHEKPIFTIATCNDYSALPAELTRAGRFDERFFVDLPSSDEREAIARVHLARLGCSADFAADIAARTERHTGAEIEALVKSAARLSNRDLTLDVIKLASGNIKPLAATKSEEVAAMRKSAKTQFRFANTLEAAASGRSIRN